MRVLALDVGTKKIGIAISCVERKIIFPILRIHFLKFEGKEFFELLKARLDNYWLEIGEVVVGDGKDPDFYNPIVKIVDQVVRILKAWTNWKVVLVSEINSSVESKNILKKLNYSLKKRKELVDSYAALLILESYFYNNKKEVLVGF